MSHTHGSRIQRHDSITRLIGNKCMEIGWQVTWALRLCTSIGLKKPDLIIHNPDKIPVVDVWDSLEPLKNSYQDKLDLYNLQPVCTNIAITYRRDKEIQFRAIVISPKGAWCKLYYHSLIYQQQQETS